MSKAVDDTTKITDVQSQYLREMLFYMKDYVELAHSAVSRRNLSDFEDALSAAANIHEQIEEYLCQQITEARPKVRTTKSYEDLIQIYGR